MKNLTAQERKWVEEILEASTTSHLCDANEIREYLAKAIVAGRTK